MLITGGTGGLGALLARHLVAQHGVRHLLLVSRSGLQAPGARDLEAELSALGASVSVVACDVSDRAQVAALLDAVPDEHPLTGVIHAAGIFDNSMIASMRLDQLEAVLRPKLDAALHLHELTQDFDLRVFVLCSSMAATVGGPGQGNYTAANAFLDALAEERRARGLAAVSVAWGLLAHSVGSNRWLPDGDAEQLLRRMSGTASLRPLSNEQALEFYDRAVTTDLASVIATPFDSRVLSTEAVAGTAPRIFTQLVRSRPRRAAPAEGGLAARVAEGDAGERRQAVFDEIRAAIALSLGHGSPAGLDMEMSFLELGIDSLVGLELRNRLHTITGLTLPTTLIFDHPTPAALVGYVEARLGESGANRSARQPEPATSGEANGAAPLPAHGAGNTLPALFRRAHRLGKLADGMLLAEAASRLRACFGLSHAEILAPTVSPLSSGPDKPLMFCFPSVVATGGPHEFTRFARSFANRRDVVAVPNPGYLPDEPLPSTIEAAAAAQAVAVERHANGRPTVLVGFSTGGLLAYATAAQCARNGAAPAAVVLIDSYTPQTISDLLSPVVDRMLETGRAHPAITDDTLTAMFAYLRLLKDWRPPELVAPTLLVAAADADTDETGVGATWPHRHAAVAVPADHLTILDDQAEATAQAIDQWLRTLAPVPKRKRLASLLRQS